MVVAHILHHVLITFLFGVSLFPPPPARGVPPPPPAGKAVDLSGASMLTAVVVEFERTRSPMGASHVAASADTTAAQKDGPSRERSLVRFPERLSVNETIERIAALPARRIPRRRRACFADLCGIAASRPNSPQRPDRRVGLSTKSRVSSQYIQ